MDKLADMQLINDRHLPDMNEQAALLQDLPQWHIGKTDTVLQLVRSFGFDNFIDALAFANRVGALAEEYNHHPALLVEWGKTTVTWWTHSLGGLHKNDFIMAAKTDRCYRAG